jgi:hypothetical protein
MQIPSFHLVHLSEGVKFELLTAEERPLLRSRMFANTNAALASLDELRRHAKSRTRYRGSHRAVEDCYFDFLDECGQPLATSCSFSSIKHLLRAQALLQVLAKRADIPIMTREVGATVN